MESILALGPLLIPIAGIVGGCAVAITVIVVRHQERIAKIERGTANRTTPAPLRSTANPQSETAPAMPSEPPITRQRP